MPVHTIECRYARKPNTWVLYDTRTCTIEEAQKYVYALNLDLRGSELQFRIKPVEG